MNRAPRPWQVWWVGFDAEPVGHEQAAQRPAIIVNSDFYREHRPGMSLVVPLTTRDRGLPWQPRVSIVSPSGNPGVALVEQIRAVSHDRLFARDRRILSAGDVDSVRFVLRQMIDVES
ncbi:MAG TPA: type II toxin-antitoxin system PemK/MazF family toxin [Nocardioidaceae bacterium]|nr:type II toxin-antitoxin system PemK/MazF family toxin [Nocardioidaceae bacterium]